MPNHNFIDLTDQVFGRLKVIRHIKKTEWKDTRWECKCDCGNMAIVRAASLKAGLTKSCGCLHREITGNINRSHGMSGSPEYRAWTKIIRRCTKPNTKEFKDYGNRGITVCKSWENNFTTFFKHVGKRPSKKHSIDRINNNGNYETGNVRWALPKVQANNSRRNHKITLNNWTLNLGQWATFVGISKFTISGRIRRNWPPAKAIFTPVRHR